MKGFSYPGKSPAKHPIEDLTLSGDGSKVTHRHNKKGKVVWVGKDGKDIPKDILNSLAGGGINEKPFKTKSPAKQQSAHGQENDYEREKTLDSNRDKSKYKYNLVDANGNVVKSITKKDYINYKNEPGTDKPTKTTSDPDVYGRKKGGSPSNPKK